MAGRVGIGPAPASKVSCDDANCTKTPSFGYESGRSRRRCCSHKLENMVYLKRRKCAEPDCTRLSSHGRSGGGARFCLLHKHADMVNLVNRRCETLGCNRRPVFASAGQKARLCSDHGKVDMTDVANHLCSAVRCGTKACWGLPGRRAAVCFIHRTEHMQKRGGDGGSGTSSRSSGISISIVDSTFDEVKPSRVSNRMPRIDPGDAVSSSYSASELVKEEPISPTRPSREWLLPVDVTTAQDAVTAAVHAFVRRNGDLLTRPQPFVIPQPGPHLHQHFYQHTSPQSSMLPQTTMHQRPGENTSMLKGTHRAYADQHLINHVPASAASLLSHLRLQHQPTPCYHHLFPSRTVAESYSFGDYYSVAGGLPSFSSAHQVGLELGFELGLGPMLVDSRVQQQEQQQYHYAAFQLQMQHHNMHEIHMQLSAGAMFRPTSNGGEHSVPVSNSTIDERLKMHADGMSRQPQGGALLPSMVDMLSRASENRRAAIV